MSNFYTGGELLSGIEYFMAGAAIVGAVLLGWIPWVLIPWLWQWFKPILIGWLV